jgi:hypothetical protein
VCTEETTDGAGMVLAKTHTIYDRALTGSDPVGCSVTDGRARGVYDGPVPGNCLRAAPSRLALASEAGSGRTGALAAGGCRRRAGVGWSAKVAESRGPGPAGPSQGTAREVRSSVS